MDNMLKALYELFLNTFTEFYILVRVNTQGVDCPVDLKKNEFVKFAGGEKSSPDINFIEEGLQIKLRFSGIPYSCYFPWESIIGIEGTGCQFLTGPEFNYKTAAPNIEFRASEKQEQLIEEYDSDYILQDTKYSHLKVWQRKKTVENSLLGDFRNNIELEKKKVKESKTANKVNILEE